MVGQRFGKWTVEALLPRSFVQAVCDCGTRRTVKAGSLKRGASKSCGCGVLEREDLRVQAEVGERFNRLVVQKILGSDKYRRRVALVLCDCGRTKVLPLLVLKNGETKSCGCLKDSQIRTIAVKHGEYKSDLYIRWQAMWDRTRNKEKYPTYALANIKVFSEWKDYVPFRDYIEKSLGPRPKWHTLDRIDNAKGYEPGNLRWATDKQQARNRSNNCLITIGEETKCVAEWAESHGLKPGTIHQRIRNGWSEEKAVLTPRNKYTAKP